jgi:hypothetical protein
MHSMKHLKRLRWAVRFVLSLGVAASVAANILHANPNPISQTIAAWPSLAFLLTVELVSRIPVTRRLRAAIRIGATAMVAGIAGWVSYWHMVDVAARFGETGTSPYLLPLTVDGLIVVASVSLIELAVKIAALEEGPRSASAPLVQAQQVVNESSSQMPVPVSPAPAGNPPAAVSRPRALVPAGRSGPQVKGPSRTSPLTGRVLMEEPPQA